MITPNARPNGSRLHVFDMDGTLLRSTATIELARHLGHLDRGQEIETLWGEGRISDTDFWRALLEICDGATDADFDKAFASSPWMAGVAEVFADITARGEAAIVISQSPTFFVERLKSWGAHEAYGSDVVPGAPLSDTATLLPEAKVEITQAALTARGLGAADCVAYGDSSSDVELFKSFANTIGVNPSSTLSKLATVEYRGTDMREAYRLGRDLIGQNDRQNINQDNT